jgi:DNA mismatch repair protein MutL
MTIVILPPDVVGKIAAGEVIERPASTAKELIENSLDAGASDIRVEIREGGRRLLRVIDDGCGIPRAEVELAVARHATSKLRTADDLLHITTLGFRGEALNSIAAVSQMTILTRSAAEETATQLRLEGGLVAARESRGAPPGTVITVENLFFNVPARLAFLRQPQTEAGHIADMVARYAQAFPERRFSLVSDGRLLFQSTGNGSLPDVLAKVHGLEVAREMIPAGAFAVDRAAADQSPQHSGALAPSTDAHAHLTPTVWGYIGLPSQHRANRNYIVFFLNHRWIQDRTLAYAVIEAYHTFLPVGRYPMATLMIEMEPSLVDVNVHPTKAEVRFRDPRAVYRAVQKAVHQALIEQAPLPSVTLPSPASTWGQPDGWDGRRDALISAGQTPNRHQLELDLPRPAPAPDDQPVLSGWPAMAAPTPPASDLPMLRVIGQAAATYIIAEGPDGLYLIDQHAAHERILYEKMMAEMQRHAVASQSLLEPVTFTPHGRHAGLLAEYASVLNGLGFTLEPFGGNTYLVRSVPAVMHRADPQQATQEILEGLAEEENLVDDDREARLVRIICKRAAIKGGQTLSLIEMRELTRQLEACQSPRTCPHGRPTMVALSALQLEKFFARR